MNLSFVESYSCKSGSMESETEKCWVGNLFHGHIFKLLFIYTWNVNDDRPRVDLMFSIIIFLFFFILFFMVSRLHLVCSNDLVLLAMNAWNSMNYATFQQQMLKYSSKSINHSLASWCPQIG